MNSEGGTLILENDKWRFTSTESHLVLLAEESGSYPVPEDDSYWLVYDEAHDLFWTTYFCSNSTICSSETCEAETSITSKIIFFV